MNISTPQGTFIIREAVVDDITELVNVHVISWNATYPNYHPKPTPEVRTKQWQNRFEKKEEDWFCFVAQKAGGEITGFATGCSFNNAALKYDAKLDKIHSLKQYHRLGLGRALVGEVAKRFISNGYTSMMLFADPQNPNIRFYDKLQGERLIEKDGKFHGTYGWRNLQMLATLCGR